MQPVKSCFHISKKGVEGRVKPGHDDGTTLPNLLKWLTAFTVRL
jgi:hypothetical protein